MINLQETIAKIKYANHDEAKLGGIARHQIYKPNLSKAFINEDAIFAFEETGFKTFRLLRILNGRRTMDFMSNYDNSLWVENSNSQQTNIFFESKDHIIELISMLSCYENYNRTHNDIYTSKGNKMSKEEIVEYLKDKI